MGPGERLQFVFRRALFEGQGNLISRLQTLNSEPKTTGNSLLAINNLLAEREGFEPPLPFRVNLISSSIPPLFYPTSPTTPNKKSLKSISPSLSMFGCGCSFNPDKTRTVKGSPVETFLIHNQEVRLNS